jgi:hypothetical protein
MFTGLRTYLPNPSPTVYKVALHSPHSTQTLNTPPATLAQARGMTHRRTFDSTAGPPHRGVNCTLTPPPSHATSVLDSSTPPPTGDRADGNKSLYLVFVGVVFLSILNCF